MDSARIQPRGVELTLLTHNPVEAVRESGSVGVFKRERAVALLTRYADRLPMQEVGGGLHETNRPALGRELHLQVAVWLMLYGLEPAMRPARRIGAPAA